MTLRNCRVLHTIRRTRSQPSNTHGNILRQLRGETENQSRLPRDLGLGTQEVGHVTFGLEAEDWGHGSGKWRRAKLNGERRDQGVGTWQLELGNGTCDLAPGTWGPGPQLGNKTLDL